MDDHSIDKEKNIKALLDIRQDIQQLIVEIQKARIEHVQDRKRLENPSSTDEGDGEGKPETQGTTLTDGDDQEPDSDDSDDEAGHSHTIDRSTTGGFTARLREARVLLHKACFLLGDAYHQAENTSDEDSLYNAAEDIRKQLLRGSEQRALKAMKILQDREDRTGAEAAKFSILAAKEAGKKTATLVSGASYYKSPYLYRNSSRKQTMLSVL